MLLKEGWTNELECSDLLRAVRVTNIKSLDSFEVVPRSNARKWDQCIIGQPHNFSMSVHK